MAATAQCRLCVAACCSTLSSPGTSRTACKERSMRSTHSLAMGAAVGVWVVVAGVSAGDGNEQEHRQGGKSRVQLGPRPFYLVDGLDAGPLKNRLSQCTDGPFHKTDFSIGHRG